MEATATSSPPPPPPPPPPSASSAVSDGAEPPAQEAAAPAAVEVGAGAEAAAAPGAAGDGEEEEGECGFCLFMKAGGCKEEFVAWEKCVEAAESAGGDVVERCFEVTAALRKCMDAHADYYEPILRAERAMAEDLESQSGGLSPSPEGASETAAAPAAEKKADSSQI